MRATMKGGEKLNKNTYACFRAFYDVRRAGGKIGDILCTKGPKLDQFAMHESIMPLLNYREGAHFKWRHSGLSGEGHEKCS